MIERPEITESAYRDAVAVYTQTMRKQVLELEKKVAELSKEIAYLRSQQLND